MQQKLFNVYNYFLSSELYYHIFVKKVTFDLDVCSVTLCLWFINMIPENNTAPPLNHKAHNVLFNLYVQCTLKSIFH